MNGGNGYYPFPIRQGSKRDFAGAWLHRGIVLFLLGFVATSTNDAAKDARSTAKDSKSSNEAVIKIKADLDILLPRIEQDIKMLNDKSAHAVTDEQLKEAEQRVSNTFRKQLDEQIKASNIQTGPTLKKSR